MARFRLSGPAQADLRRIVAASFERWGLEASRRYSAILTAAMSQIASDPSGRLTRDRSDILPGVRSFHIRHAHARNLAARVKNPAHILYYRAVGPGLIEIVRVLHDRMEPRLHLTPDSEP